MFGNRNGGNGSGPVDAQQGPGPADPTPQLPPLRQFLVLRDSLEQRDSKDGPEYYLEQLLVKAHAFALSQSGALSFFEMIIDPVLGPRERLVKMFAKFDEVTEVLVALAAPSKLTH